MHTALAILLHPYTLVACAVLLALLLLAVAWFAARRFWRRRRDADALADGLLGTPDDPVPADRDRAPLDSRFAEALAVLRDSAGQSGRRGWLRGGDYLYDKPWYVFIGAPGSGKTTALLNAGLGFPLAARMGQAAVRGAAGTRYCDWWFTDEAVLLDTDGRYALQASDGQPAEPADVAGWERFLALLKKTRPRRPLNGVLLTVSVQDLLQKSPTERRAHAAQLRARLQELHTGLGVRPPVYVLVTKADLIAGFDETFGDLGKEEREQAWGFSFAYEPDARDSSPMQAFGSEFAALDKRLRERLLDRLEAGRGPLRRAAAFAFPQQFAALKGLLGGFLEAVFAGGGSLDETALLRGVYFTSGTQEGTPVDRVLGTLARAFGIDGRADTAAGARGKSFFLSRLMREVVFAEQGLVGENRRAETLRRVRRRAGALALGLACVALVAGWSVAWRRNVAYLAEV